MGRSCSEAPDRIGCAQIDMNNAPAEIAVQDALEPRFGPGAVIVTAHGGWFGRRGVPILE